MRCDLNMGIHSKPQQGFMAMPLTVPSPTWVNQAVFDMHAQRP